MIMRTVMVVQVNVYDHFLVPIHMELVSET